MRRLARFIASCIRLRSVRLALDRNGRRTVSLERKTKGGIVIESREQSAASLARNQRIKGAKA